MTDYSLFEQSGGFLSDEHERINQPAFASAEKSEDDLIKQMPTLNFSQPLSRHFLSACLPPQLANIRRTAERFIINPSNELLKVRDGASVMKKETKDSNAFNDEIEDADFAACILNNLPTSYDDFEIKELHLKLERNLSSPLMTCQSPNTDSGRVSAGSSLTKSSNMHPHDTTNMPLDADDMEVAMINESFEEQQKQHRLYDNPGLKNLFYSQPNMPPEDRTDAVLSSCRVKMVAPSGTAAFDSGIFTANPSCFDVMQLRKSDANDAFNKSETSVHSSTSTSNVTLTSSLQNIALGDSFGNLFSAVPSEGSVNIHEPLLKFNKPIADTKQKINSGLVDDKMDATEALAVDVVESLFTNVSLDETTASNEKKCEVGRFSPESNQACQKFLSNAVDSWEELDNEDFKPHFDLNKVSTANSKANQEKTASYVLNMPHVLEAYDLSLGYTDTDVKSELAKYEKGDVGIHKVDNSKCLIVFSSATAALRALIAARRQCTTATTGLHLRSLCDAAPATQEKARLYEAFLRPYKPRPHTTALVARRLVEGALGKRSNVSVATLQAERKQLKDAKSNKQMKAAIWNDTL